MKNAILLILILFLVNPYVYPEENNGQIDLNKEEKDDVFLDECLERFEQINDELQGELRDEDRGKLLYQKAWIMFATFGELCLRTATESLLKAIELIPDKDEYKEFLGEAYDELWKKREFNEDDEISNSLSELKERVKIVVDTYRMKQE